MSLSNFFTSTDVTFANFGVKCNSKRDYIISTSPSNEDGQHPIETSDINLINVEEDSKLFFHRPNVGKINSADCVDMDCDAKKKCMVKDLDGTFLEIGSGGAALPQSEWEWNGDPRRGLGDYRIPKTLLTTLDGARIAVDDIAPNKGVIGNKDCEWMDSWTAYKCDQGANYEMLIIESMDSDTETRRLSPVAILGKNIAS
ncbi:PKHD1L1 [Bugula neritina]|uniref:PKHD1L1 n=1 Tax=Bugula neritina TaxID=10212 RepID=A0A7J7KHI3_BUGNE|nr:PKHD1L1 [Bugula neritina]